MTIDLTFLIKVALLHQNTTDAPVVTLINMIYKMAALTVLTLMIHCSIALINDLPLSRAKRQSTDQENTCTLLQGPPGRDGRDGMPGPPGTGHISYSQAKEFKNDITQQLKQLLTDTLQNYTQQQHQSTTSPGTIGRSSGNPANCCLDIYQSDPGAATGYYWLYAQLNGVQHTRQVYCDMETWHCGVKGGWMRVAHINMTQPSAQCPTPYRQITSPRKFCARPSSGCVSAVFSTYGKRYKRVCGQAVGYQYSNMDAFQVARGVTVDINSHYVEGISITHGFPRKHIWTYAVGLSDDYNYGGTNNCPCAKYPGPSPPSFVRDHYYCESGNTGVHENIVYTNDPLWDGEGCGAGNNCCSQSGMPWFCRELPMETDDDIEVRLCANERITNEDIYLEILEIYIN